MFVVIDKPAEMPKELIEAAVERTGAQLSSKMPFAEQGRAIAGRLQHLSQGHLVRRDAPRMLRRIIDAPLGTLHSPRTPLHYLFSLNGWIEEDRLYVRWLYSDRHYERSTVEQIANRFITNLRAIISECHLYAQKPVLKAAPEFDWTQNDVSNIATAIGKAIGKSQGKLWTVGYTVRNGLIRVFMVRPPHDDEKDAYHG